MNDPRDTLANSRVAHTALRGQIDAPRFVDGTRQSVTVPVADLHAAPDAPGLERQLLFGEPFLMLEEQHGLAFGRAELSGYVGYVDAAALGTWVDPTHVVAARTTLGFGGPCIKTPEPVALSLGSRVTVTGQTGALAQTTRGLFIPKAHLRPVTDPETDPVGVAARLLGAPYLWGGNAAFGIDCSGLVQIALRACGLPCPGDSGQQEQTLGQHLPDGAPMQRGDLLFWPGHVAWVADQDRILHANGHDMAVAYERLGDALARIDQQGDGPLRAHKRL